MSDSQTLVFIRHGETDWNVAERLQGHNDIPLNARGRSQAEELARSLSHFEISAFLSSDLLRAVETAHILAQNKNLPVYLDERLRERHPGKLEGLTRSEIASRYKTDWFDLVRRGNFDKPASRALLIEDNESIALRASTAIEQFLRKRSYRSVGIATHEGVIKAFLSVCCGVETLDYLNNGAFTVVTRSSRRAPWEFVFIPSEKDNLVFCQNGGGRR